MRATLDATRWFRPLIGIGLTACAGDVTGLEARPPFDLGCGTLNVHSCSEDSYCFGPSQCDAVWSCQREPPCSAAPGFRACGCDGLLTHVAAGCPDRHAYALNDLGNLEAFGGLAEDGRAQIAEDGSPCSLQVTPPYLAPVEIRGRGFDAFEGHRVWVRGPSGPFSIENGRFEFFSAAAPLGDSYFWVLLDRNGDGRCDAAEDVVWGASATLDLVRFVVRIDLTPPRPGETHPSFCERF